MQTLTLHQAKAKIDQCNLDLYRFKVGAFFLDTVYSRPASYVQWVMACVCEQFYTKVQF